MPMMRFFLSCTPAETRKNTDNVPRLSHAKNTEIESICNNDHGSLEIRASLATLISSVCWPRRCRYFKLEEAQPFLPVLSVHHHTVPVSGNC